MKSLNKTDITILKWLWRQKDQVYQNDIPKLTGLDANAVTKSLYKLEKMNLVIRKPTVHNKRRTYIVQLNHEVASKILDELNIVLDPIETFNEIVKIPCITCQYINRCYEGGFYDPVHCPHLFTYVFQQKR